MAGLDGAAYRFVRYRKTYEVTGCTSDGAVFCPEHCPDPDTCEETHGACFLGDEWQCALGACEVCGDLIEGTVIHGVFGETCEYCGVEVPAEGV